MTNIAKFDVDDDGEDYGFALTPGQPAELKLRLDPPIGIQRVRFQVFNPDAFDPNLKNIFENPPRASGGAPTVSLVGATTGQTVSATTPGSPVTFPAQTGLHSWIVRCVVNGGYRVGPNGVARPDPDLAWERLLYLPGAILGTRKIIPTESTQGGVEGWSEPFNALLDGVVAGDFPFSRNQMLVASEIVDENDDAIIDFNQGLAIRLLLDQSINVLTIVPPSHATTLCTCPKLSLVQGDDGGPHTIGTWEGCVFLGTAPSGSPPQLSEAAGSVNLLAAIFHGGSDALRLVPTPSSGQGFPV